MVSMSAETLQTLSPTECQELLHRGGVGRIGVSVGALPAIFPVRFALFGNDIVFRIAPATLLSAAVAGTVVAFETDSLDQNGTEGWSVLVVGRGELISDPVELEAARRLPLVPWSTDDDDLFVRVPADLLSGRAFVGSRSRAPAFGPT